MGEEDNETGCKCLERDAPRPFPLGISRYRFEIASIFPSLLLSSQIPNEYLVNEFSRQRLSSCEFLLNSFNNEFYYASQYRAQLG